MSRGHGQPAPPTTGGWCRPLLAAGWLALALVGRAGADPAGVPEPTAAEERAFAAAVARVEGAVVRLEPVGGSSAPLGGGAEAVPGSGPTSGLVIDPAGWIVTTSFGVPADTEQVVVVRSDGTRLAARAAGRDLSRGLVLLRSGPLGDAPDLETSPRTDLAPGQWAIGVGRGWTHRAVNVSVGIVSAVNRAWGRGVQTDAATSPANYGGPLVDIRGRVIGLIAPLPADMAGMPTGTELYDAGIGFAVPLEDILAVRSRLEAGVSLEPGILGIAYRSRDGINGEPVLGSVRQGSPAATAGLRAGDRIVALDGRPVARIAEVRHGLARRFAGERVELRLARGAETLNLKVELVASLPPWRRALLGILPAAPSQPGVRVSWVLPGSPAAAAGLEAGDILESASIAEADAAAKNLELADPRTLAGLLASLEPGSKVALRVRRGETVQNIDGVTSVAPGEIPEVIPAAIEIDPTGLTGETTVVELAGADVEDPALAVLPAGDAVKGVLVYLGPPHGRATPAEAEAWRIAAGRHGVVVVIPGSAEPDRWGRADLARIERALAALGKRARIDPARLAVAGRQAGGSFAWVAAERIAAPVRGVAIQDSSLPRQAVIRPLEPGAGPWVLLGQGRGDLGRVVAEDRRRLEGAGITVGTLPTTDDAPPVELLCGWVTLLGLL